MGGAGGGLLVGPPAPVRRRSVVGIAAPARGGMMAAAGDPGIPAMTAASVRSRVDDADIGDIDDDDRIFLFGL